MDRDNNYYSQEFFPAVGVNDEVIRTRVEAVARDMELKFHSRFPGKPDSPPLPISITTWARLSQINPNSGGVHTFEGARERELGLNIPWAACLELEREVLAGVASLYSPCFDEFEGYINTGSTEGNIAAFWLGRNLLSRAPCDGSPNEIAVLIPRTAHMSLFKAAEVVGLGVEAWTRCDECGVSHMNSSETSSGTCRILDVDDRFHVDINSFTTAMQDCLHLGIKRFIVVATLGTTVLGTIDPIAEMCQIIRSFKNDNNIEVFFHIDGASGGLIAPFSAPMRDSLNVAQWAEVSSLSIDWHKFGLVPYGAGSLICRKGLIRHISRQDKYGRLGHGTTLIGSRSGAMTAACWSVMKQLGRSGFSELVDKCLKNTQLLKRYLERIPGIQVLNSSDIHLVPLRIAPDSPVRRVLAQHGIAAEHVAKNGISCPQETFPLYVMRHLETGDIHKFVAEIHQELEFANSPKLDTANNCC